VITIDEAIDHVLDAVRVLPAEHVPLLQGLGRAAAEDVVSPERVPPFDNSAMDGFAVRAAELSAGRRRFAIAVALPAGTTATAPVPPGAAAKIMTGAPLPDGVDTVVPVELTVQEGEVVVVTEPVPAGANVRRAAEDVAVGDVLLRRGSRLGPAELGLLASVGFAAVAVVRRPRVAVLATGSELVPIGEPVGPGQIRNSNSCTAYAQTMEAGAEPVLLGIARDELSETRRLISDALQHDVVISSGGVSVGEWDFVKQVQEELGVQRRFWGVATKPGKPLAFGVRGSTLVFGVPGNPVASMVCFELYVRPALLALQGRPDVYRPWVRAAALEPVHRTRERTEARRCRLEHDDGRWRFTTTGPQGSAILRSMALAQGLALVPAGYPGGEPGESFVVQLLQGSAEERPPYPG
jgi:molybdopterin molybdotransferase